MNERRTQELLRELLMLYSRYGPTEFEKAIQELETGTATEKLLHLTRSSRRMFATLPNSSAGKEGGTKKRKSPKERLEQFVADVSNRGDEESIIVAQFIADIAQRKALRNAPILREYSQRLGIASDAKVDRRLLAMKIGDVLLNEPPERRRAHMAAAMQLGPEASSLQAWSRIIVKDERNRS